ncbi:MAG: hypothetical protein J6P16_02005 [Eubacterium sp.]|nr:hypothetical protein [Eubacterium sp.]
MMKFKNAKKRGKWMIQTGKGNRMIRIKSKRPGKWGLKFKFGSKNQNRMKKMDKLPKLKKMGKMDKMKKMHKIAKLPKLKMKHK